MVTRPDSSATLTRRLAQLASFLIRHWILLLALVIAVYVMSAFWLLGHSNPGLEIVEYVSESDANVVLGTATMNHVHSVGLTHKGSMLHVYVLGSGFLILKRSAAMKTCPNTWSVAGEHCQVGETFEACAMRCLQEEFALSLKDTTRFLSITDRPSFLNLSYPGRLSADGAPLPRWDLTWAGDFLAVLPSHAKDAFTLDNEAHGHRFVQQPELVQWLQNTPTDFCHPIIADHLVNVLRGVCLHLPQPESCAP
mmetsp:Transcript_53249/g.115629  ORF Transcript_53249/g.115629 Transcript_53249/m.115629 type:complete len:252 (-) Transcript_53249:169-924(-)